MTLRQKTICFIVGSLFSGSTLLGNSLNGSPEVIFLGETDRLRYFRRYENCPDYYVDQSILSENNHMPCEFWNRAFLTKLKWLSTAEAFLEIIERTGTSIVLDGSKNIDWLIDLYPSLIEKYNVVAIVSARNPFAFCSSYRKLNQVSAWAAAEVWRNVYSHTLRCLSSYSIPNILIRYEDFALDPERFLQQKLTRFLGIPFHPQMMQYWQVPNYALGGNTGAYLQFQQFQHAKLDPSEQWKPEYYHNKPFGGWVSERWLDVLDEDQIAEIASLDGVMATAFNLGYNLTALIRQHRDKQLLGNNGLECKSC
ncbi:MAG: sulfotransferase [Elainella sp. C42_A2020_010]|nr:sulfotransferase [Elainella sp. C42_A2020_010]RNJ71208.1 MAG: sulfotransferase [Leptolyngbya sp. IPPAS B-1204]